MTQKGVTPEQKLEAYKKHGSFSGAARELGIDREAVRRTLHNMGIDLKSAIPDNSTGDGKVNNVIDIATRKPLERIDTPEGETAQQFMKRWAKSIKDGRFNSIAIVVMDENKFCDYGIITQDDNVLPIFCLMIDDIKDQMKGMIFGFEDEES